MGSRTGGRRGVPRRVRSARGRGHDNAARRSRTHTPAGLRLGRVRGVGFARKGRRGEQKGRGWTARRQAREARRPAAARRSAGLHRVARGRGAQQLAQPAAQHFSRSSQKERRAPPRHLDKSGMPLHTPTASFTAQKVSFIAKIICPPPAFSPYVPRFSLPSFSLFRLVHL